MKDSSECNTWFGEKLFKNDETQADGAPKHGEIRKNKTIIITSIITIILKPWTSGSAPQESQELDRDSLQPLKPRLPWHWLAAHWKSASRRRAQWHQNKIQNSSDALNSISVSLARTESAIQKKNKRQKIFSRHYHCKKMMYFLLCVEIKEKNYAKL